MPDLSQRLAVLDASYKALEARVTVLEGTVARMRAELADLRAQRIPAERIPSPVHPTRARPILFSETGDSTGGS